MNAKRNLLIGVILGGVLGWMLGFLRFPYVERNSSFLLGFITCFAIAVLIFYFLSIVKNRSGQKAKTTSKYNFTMLLLILVVATASVISNVIIYKQNASLKTQITEEHKKRNDLSEMIETAGSGNLASFMNTILDDADEELTAHGALSDSTVNKIAALSYSFKPYKYFEGDSLSEKKMSPERGQLLLALLLMDIDSASFAKIKSNVTFSGANLNGADLHGVDMSNADLKGAHFKEANLSCSNLNGADVSDANLYAANLDSAKLTGTNLKRSGMQWAKLNDAILKMADMNGAQMANVQFINADLYKAKMQYADLTGALFHKANLRGVDMMGTDLSRANFSEAIMNNTDMRLVKPEETIFNNAELSKAIVDSTWMKNLTTWRLIGMQVIQNNYQLVNDTADQWNNPLFRLIKAETDTSKAEMK